MHKNRKFLTQAYKRACKLLSNALLRLEMLSAVILLLGVVLTQASVNAVSLDERIVQYGSNGGTTVVLLSVAYLEQSAVFPTNNGFLRRIAYAETGDGISSSVEFHNIWAVSQEGLEQTKIPDHPTLNVKRNLIALELDIDWLMVDWDDLKRPFYSALAARLLLFLAPELIPDFSDIPDQARFWKQYYNVDGSLSEFIGAANELEGGHKN